MVDRLLGAGRSSKWIHLWDVVLFDLCPEPLLGRTLGEVLGVIHTGEEDNQGSDMGTHGRMTDAGTMRSGPSGSCTEDIAPPNRYAKEFYSQDRYAQAGISSHIPDRRPGHDASTMRRRRDAEIHRDNGNLPSDFSRHADAELLMRLAGILHETHTLQRKTPVISRYPWNSHSAGPRTRPDIGDPRCLVEILGARALKSLQTGGMGIIPGNSSDSPIFSGDNCLAEDLGIPLDGLRAPLDLLLFLSYAAGKSESSSREGRPGYEALKRSQPAKDDLSHSGEVLDASDMLAGPGAFDPQVSGRPELFPEIPLSRTASEMVDARGGMRISSPGASSLPPVPFSRPAGMMPVSLASDLSLLEAMKESSEAGEDLSALASKIKRILDEEARRYGIDV